MLNETMTQLQFKEIQAEVQARAIGTQSKQRIANMTPASHLHTVETRQQETQEARQLLDSQQHVPFMGLTQIDRLLTQVQKGLILTPTELIECGDFLRSSRLMTRFFEKNQYQAPLLFQYSQQLPQLLSVEEALTSKIQHQKVLDTASKNLKKVRKTIATLEQEIQEQLLKFLKHPKNKERIQERMIVQKNDHYTIPIKASYKNTVAGTVIEQSGRGTTVFIEPSAVMKLNERLILAKAEEVAEEYQVLAELTGLLAENEATIQQLLETITVFDVIFARGKYSREINGRTPKVNKSERIIIKNGRHPLLPTAAVPLTVSLGDTYRGIVITGANAGGKTVVLKTVGLLTLMTMFGLQIPADEGTEMAVFDHIFVDIGDQQSMENALSTFSGHMKNIATILKKTKRNSLVLLDEIGSGTEPNEGAALAIAIMETLYEKGALLVATTHYGEIKQFAQGHEDFIPAAMAFNRETLSPQYQLKVGETGDSQALWIAQKMQMSPELIQRAQGYMLKKEYRLTKRSYQTQPVLKETEGTITKFSQGDRVLVTETQETGLIYEDDGSSQVVVWLANQPVKVLRKRVIRLMTVEELYPAGYDLTSLFTDFQTRKQQKDLERGSKKAHKALAKEAKKRKQRSELTDDCKNY